MPESNWDAVRDALGETTLTLGPYFAYQVLSTPRHLLFTLARYKFAARLLPNDRPVEVLELGCTEGIGALLLAEDGHRVTGVDADASAIGYAQSTLARPNLAFIEDDFLGKVYGTFRAVVSLDVIEHIPRSAEHEFMRTIHSNLASNGFCVIGTPNQTAAPYASEPSRIAHVNLYTAERLSALVSAYFENVFMFGLNDEVAHTGFYPMCHYLVALGCHKRAGPAQTS